MSSTTPHYVNISAYKFVNLDNVSKLQEHLKSRFQELGLKGTCLLSTEGFNLFLAGTPNAIAETKQLINALLSPGFNDFKESFSSHQPFKRLLVKIKKEIISFGQCGIEPAKHPAPRVSPKQLKQWLDEGTELILLDTRNDYEMRLGKFKEAYSLHLNHFREFAQKIQELPSHFKKKKMVTYCTGGIRCEKAAPFLQGQGFEEVYQLDGGILRYFEECGAAHYEGDCFVFDNRVALDSTLTETSTVQCFACRMPVTLAEQQLPSYVVGESCPACYTGSSVSQQKEASHGISEC